MFNKGQQIGYYTLLKFLGQGAFGEVWLAENPSNSPSVKVAIKLPRNDQIDWQAVKDEIGVWTLAGKHKNILPIIEAETFGKQIAIVSEFAPDGTLQDLLKRQGSLVVANSVEIITGILDGLAHLHKRTIIHRDLKPDNVLFQGKIPRLSDFGISRAMQIDSWSDIPKGTLSYMSPEALDGKRNAQTDIWSVGVILYQLLSGRLPFPQKTHVELVGALVMKEPAPLPDSVPQFLQDIIKKSLAKELSERYQTADEMRKDLQSISEDFSQAKTFSDEPTIEVIADSGKTETVTEPKAEERNHHDQVIKDRTKEIELAPYESGTARAYFERGHAYFAKGDCDNAFKDFDQAIALDEFPSKSFPPEYHVRGLSKAIEVTPGDADAYVNRGILYDALGYCDQAIADYGTALKINPHHKNAKDKIEKIVEKKDVLTKAKKAQEPKLEEEQRLEQSEQAKRHNAQVSPDLRLIPYRKADKWGFCDSTKNIVIESRYDKTYPFSEDLACVVENGKSGFIDKTGREIIPIKYDTFIYFIRQGLGCMKEGLACVELNRKYGYVDKTGQEITEIKYHGAESFNEGLARVWLNGKYGYIDKTGREIIPIKYGYHTESFSEGLARVTLNDKYGFIDKTGQEITQIRYDNAESFSEGLALVRLDDKCGFIDKTGREIIPIEYGHFTQSFSEGLAVVQMGPGLKFGYIDKTGREILSIGYENAHPFSEGLAIVLSRSSGLLGLLKRKYGYIDKTGREVIPINYDVAESFSEGLACVTLNDKCGYIDKIGREIIPIKYYIAHAHSQGSFRDGLVRVTLNGKRGYIGRDGTEYFED